MGITTNAKDNSGCDKLCEFQKTIFQKMTKKKQKLKLGSKVCQWLVRSLLYKALNTQADILLITNKLTKPSTDSDVKYYEALLHVFIYLRVYPDYALEFDANASLSLVHQICKQHKNLTTDIVVFTDTP